MWLYEGSRYILGESGAKAVYCIGINPSTATPAKLDPTVNRVKDIVCHNSKNTATYKDFDSWVMLNVYPQNATDPAQVDTACFSDYHRKNLDTFEKHVPNGAVIWAAWGDLIEKRPYFTQCLKDIGEVLGKKNVSWVTAGLTGKGNPRHPLFLPKSTLLDIFDFTAYLKTKEIVC